MAPKLSDAFKVVNKFHRPTVGQKEAIMSNRQTSTVTSSMNVADTPATRTPIGRAIPDNPQTLASFAPAKLVDAERGDSVNTGLSLGSQMSAAVARRVDQRDVRNDFGWGPSSGDSRNQPGDTAKASLWEASGSDKGPRGQMSGQRNQRSYNEDGKSFRSTSNAVDSDQGN